MHCGGCGFSLSSALDCVHMASRTRRPGYGTITLSFDGTRSSYSELVAAYPLKLLAPHSDNVRVALVYILSYGGGLVGGDLVHLDVEVRSGAALLALTQVRRSCSRHL
jgi:urease accessory protein UreH